jgi:4-diphosphocytidyl-2-C-methyl-D-erythritol kinase
MSETLNLRAPAKINLTLEVLGRRSDGYHGVRSLMVPLALADEVAIEPSRRFIFECSDHDLEGDDNLVVRALHALGELPAVHVVLHKRIPVQAGLGGGSSDAAAILRAAMHGAFGDVGVRDWLGIARDLGSDVPFFLAGTAALVEGTGERITPAGALPPWQALIVKPPVAVSTAAAYEALDAQPRPQRPRNDSVSIASLEALQRGDFERAESLLQNDFQDSIGAQSAEIAFAFDALRAAGARNTLLAGSGSCVFTIVPTQAAIDSLRQRLALPAEYEIFPTAFASTPEWRSASNA